MKTTHSLQESLGADVEYGVTSHLVLPVKTAKPTDPDFVIQVSGLDLEREFTHLPYLLRDVPKWYVALVTESGATIEENVLETQPAESIEHRLISCVGVMVGKYKLDRR